MKQEDSPNSTLNEIMLSKETSEKKFNTALFESFIPKKPKTFQKIFRIQKYVKQNKFKDKLINYRELSDDEIEMMKKDSSKAKKLLPFSKVNFSKLTNSEKQVRYTMMKKLVKNLKGKFNKLNNNLEKNPSRFLNKYLNMKLSKTPEKCDDPEDTISAIHQEKPELIQQSNMPLEKKENFFGNLFESVCKSSEYENFEYKDEKHLVKNLIEYLSNEDSDLNCIQIKHISSILRSIKSDNSNCSNSSLHECFPRKDRNYLLSCGEKYEITTEEFKNIYQFRNDKEFGRIYLGMEKAPLEIKLEKDKKNPTSINFSDGSCNQTRNQVSTAYNINPCSQNIDTCNSTINNIKASTPIPSNNNLPLCQNLFINNNFQQQPQQNENIQPLTSMMNSYNLFNNYSNYNQTPQTQQQTNPLFINTNNNDYMTLMNNLLYQQQMFHQQKSNMYGNIR
jgi:hypothetical protein